MTENNLSRLQLVRHQVAIKAMGVFIASILLLLIGLWPLVRSAGSLIRKIDARGKEAEALSKKVTLLSQIDQQVLKSRATVIKAALPESKDIVAYLGAVDGLSKELGLSFGGITVTPGDVSGDSQKSNAGRSKNSRKVALLNVLDTEVSITGSRDGIYTFLRQVEQTLPLMQVSDVVINRIDDDLYTMSLSLGMLWAPVMSMDLKGAINLFTEKEEGYFQKLSVFTAYEGSRIDSANNSASQGKTDLFKQE